MPTYEYHCDTCGHTFEEFQAISEPPVDRCPECGAVPRRLISGGTGLIFKGSGFYITDYRDKKYNEAATKDSPGSTESTAKKESSDSPSKPDSSPSEPKKPSGT